MRVRSAPPHVAEMTQPHGVLLVNLGSPSEPTPKAVRRYLREFLGDPLVVDAPRLQWWFVLRLFVLPRRGRSTARAYRKIWSAEGSPLVATTRRQAAALAERLGGEHRIEIAMRYGEPSIEAGLARLAKLGVSDVRLFSMYPQASQASTETVDRLAEAITARTPGAATLEIVPPFFAHPSYIEALRSSVVETLEHSPADHIVFSFHGYPVRFIENGDPYQSHCIETARLLANALELSPDEWTMAYQSHFGREAWLTPDTAELVPGLAKRFGRVAVVTPGFPTDCLETLEEIKIRLSRAFVEAGGKELVVVPCLNERADWIDAMVAIVSGD